LHTSLDKVKRDCSLDGSMAQDNQVVAMCVVEDNPVVDMREPCKVQVIAEAPAMVHLKMEDDLSILPPSMRKNFLASMNRNRAAFAALAKL